MKLSLSVTQVVFAGVLAAAVVPGSGCRLMSGEPVAPKPIPVLAWNIDELGKASP